MKKLILQIISNNKLLIQNIAVGFVTAIIVVVVSILSANLLYNEKKLVKRGFEVAIKIETENVSGVAIGDLPAATGKGSLKSAAGSNSKSADIASLIKIADANAGAKIAKKCITCHTMEKGGANKIGPNLSGIVGRRKASISGFAYSDAMKSKGGVWNIEDLNKFITKPKDFVPGTKMPFAGLKKDQDRANVIAYLQQNK